MTADPMTVAPPDGLTIGRGALRQLHQSLAHYSGDQVVTILQEAGYASGEGIYRAFCGWLHGRWGV